MIEKAPDSRSACGMKDCGNRATILIAWPRRFPISVCQPCWDPIYYTVQGQGGRFLSTQEWVEWLKSHAKPHLLPPERIPSGA